MDGSDIPATSDRTARPSELAKGVAIVVALGVFGLLAYAIQSTIGVLVAVLLGGLSGVVLWWALRTSLPKHRLDGVLDTLLELGAIPSHDQLAPTLSNGTATASYMEAVRTIHDQTTGRVVLFTSPSPGQGATTVALNVAIAATRLGRRVVLIDADTTHHGLARFLSTGPVPGLTELAAGACTLLEASRMLTIDDTRQIPLIAPGAAHGDPSLLGGIGIGDAIDRISERADLVIIDAPPIGWSDATPHLAVHADGSILVVTPHGDPRAASRAAEELAEVGAPPLGFIVNRSGGHAPAVPPEDVATSTSAPAPILTSDATERPAEQAEPTTEQSSSSPTRRKVFTVANVVFVASTIIVLVLLLTMADSHALVIAAVLSATAVGLAVWWFLVVRAGRSGTLKAGPMALRALTGVVVLLVGYGVFTAAQLWGSWNSMDRQKYALAEARAVLMEPIDTVTTTTTIPDVQPVTNEPQPPSSPLPSEPFVTMLLIGSDEDSGNGDVILYLVLPTNGADPFMMSFPRDLYVSNPCTGGSTRINILTKGCDAKNINGGTLLSVKVSDMTGIDVDHFAEFDFAGFIDIIDAVGGIEICLDHAVRDDKAHLDLPEGCTNASGAQALAWVRSRHTEEFRDGGWRTFPGRGDLMRNQHQQEVVLQLIKKLKTFSSPQQLTEVVSAIADTFILSDTLSLTDAISLAWSARDIDVETINVLEIPVRLSRSPSDQSILVETVSPKDVIATHYGNALPMERP